MTAVTAGYGGFLLASAAHTSGVPEFEPFIRYNRFGGSSIAFTAILRAREFSDNFLIQHEFIEALTRRFAEERIVIPFPIRAVHPTQETAHNVDKTE